jgi:hypothetical protein
MEKKKINNQEYELCGAQKQKYAKGKARKKDRMTSVVKPLK